MDDDSWQPFIRFATRGAAAPVAAILEAQGVQTCLLARRLASGVETDFVLAVPNGLAHRAKWVLAQSDFCDAELDFLATGYLPPPD
jgi:hypothetical protein